MEIERPLFYQRFICKSILEAIPNNKEDVLHLIDPLDLKGRPIVAGYNTPTCYLSELIEKILKPIVETQRIYIKDDWDYLKQLPSQVEGTYFYVMLHHYTQV